MKKHKYRIITKNGRYKVYIDNMLFLSFNQIDYLGHYAFKDDEFLYRIDIYLKGENVIETSYKTKEVWTQILKILDTI